MYDMQFEATTDADWAVAIELIDADTNLPLDLGDDTIFRFGINDEYGSRLSYYTDDGTDVLTRPVPEVIQWIIPKASMAGLDNARTYKIGCTFETAEGITQLFIGSVAIIDGGIS